jgi:hypothetical protein
MERADLTNRFAYHPPQDERTKATHELIRDLHLEIATELNGQLPDSRELSLAISSLEQSMMWANAALARHRPTEVGGVPTWERKG